MVRKSSFRFFNMWTDHSDFLSTVESAWNSGFRGTAQFVLCRKLKALKSPLKLLNRNHFGHISERTKEANSALKLAELEIQQDPTNSLLHLEIQSLRKNAWFLNNAERNFYQQKAKCEYIINSDKCTKFFHALVKRNCKRNFIAAITLPDGSTSTAYDQVSKAFVDHFSSLLGSRAEAQPINRDIWSIGPVLSTDQSLLLSKEISEHEIKSALDSIGDNKSPGPDGYSACFFKRSWHIIGHSVCDAVLEFFANAALLKEINHTVIALIPKSSHASTVGDFRPIACCNVIYKLITKILANRLSPMLNSIVDRAQSAFVPGRLMSDNIHLMQELLRGYNRKRTSPRCTIKIDLRKAYDSISWDFLYEALVGLHFPVCFVRWVLECVSTPSYSISINGNVHGFFKGKRGLRQGDPLSPYLFILCLEYLSRLIRKRTENSEFNFHPKCGGLKITHLAFADDLMLLARGDPISIGILMECLREFGACSGLQLNVHKSNIYMAGMDNQIATDIQASTQLSIGSMPFRYLGIPLAATSLKVMNFGPLIESINSCIAVWSGSSLSYAGRIELIRSVLQGIQCFWLSIFPIPATVRAQIIRLCRRFLWGSKRALVAWSEVCLPKREGGLSFRNLKAWNSALLSKTLWNICAKKDSLWIQWVNHEYIRSRSIWDKVKHSRDSPLLKNILSIRDNLLLHFVDKNAAMDQLSKWNSSSTCKTSNAYDFFRHQGQAKPWANLVWSPLITPKHSFILWLSLKGRLNTRDRLEFLDIDQVCVLCGNQPETTKHLFFACQFSCGIWSSIRQWLGLHRSMSTLESAAKWFKKEIKGSSWQSKAKRIAFACTVYYIWMARNCRIFEGICHSVQGLIARIKSHVYRIIYGNFPQVVHMFNDRASAVVGTHPLN